MSKKGRCHLHDKVKEQNIFGLALIVTGNLVHSAIVLGEFLPTLVSKQSSNVVFHFKLIYIKNPILISHELRKTLGAKKGMPH